MIGADPAAVAGARLSRAVVRRVWRFATPYRRSILLFVGIIAAAALIGLAPPLLFRQILDDAIPNHDRGLLNVLAALVVVTALADAALALGERYYSARIGEGIIYDLRVSLFDHVQRMPMSFFTRAQTGALNSRLNNDVMGAQRAVTGTLGSVVSNVITLIANGTAIVLLEWRFAVISLVLLPLFIVPAKRVGRRLQQLTRQQMDLNASMNTTISERLNVAGALLVKLFGHHDAETRDFAARADGVRAVGVRSAVYGRTFFVALGLVGALATAAVYWIGGQLAVSGTLTVGTLVALATFVSRIYGPLTALTNVRVDVMTALVSFERVFEVLDSPSPIQDRPGAVDLIAPAGRIELDHVRFAYPDRPIVASLEASGPGSHEPLDRPYVLDDVTATIEPGHLVALVGTSGAGKTTLSQLVPRLYDVSDGAIRIDGIDVRDLTQESLRAAIGVVSQDPHLFHDTVGNNLRYGRPAATMAEVMAAVRAAQIEELVLSLPDGLDTLVGERGYRLSGGEKQRLAIARMLLKDPAIVVLDEATSHLDAENELLVQQALATALAGRTSLVIAHRLSTIAAADNILVLDGGRIVQSGTHEELLFQGGLYADLYRTLLREERQSAADSADEAVAELQI
ncbi:MAG TPA: ABC transporter ATP-binding protein [Acidimicrobiales bacterium]|jgi:ATP-binding cassette subfamily B protein|nr:ABC transporter ATP-binding protein [Acidimicrobiales bacterium]